MSKVSLSLSLDAQCQIRYLPTLYRSNSIMMAMAVFQERWGGGGAKRLKLPSILEEKRVLDKYMGIFVAGTCFSWDRVKKRNEAQAK